MSNSSEPDALDPRWTPIACARCGAVFGCGAQMRVGAAPCWCTRLPALGAAQIAASGASSCLCPTCLQLIANPQRQGAR